MTASPTPAETAPPAPDPRPRVGYLGPRGTFSEQALRASVDAATVQPTPMATIHDAVMAVQDGAVRWSLVPIENSIEGPVTVTLDALALEADAVRIVGEIVLAVRQCLIAREPLALTDVRAIASHPQALGQCAEFLREQLPGAEVHTANSTAEAVRLAGESAEPGWAALGPALAAEAYGCVVLREGVEDRHDNETRFVWLSRRADDEPSWTAEAAPARKTSLVFSGAGAGHPGWLVDCLSEFARREVNLTKIESRPARSRLGSYIFFLDLEGGEEETAVAEALIGLRGHCDAVRVLGSYAVSGT
jgi:prephenate dehydratase